MQAFLLLGLQHISQYLVDPCPWHLGLRVILRGDLTQFVFGVPVLIEDFVVVFGQL